MEMIMMHLTRWPNKQAELISSSSMVMMNDIVGLYPEIKQYILEYVYHPDDDSENLILNHDCLIMAITATRALFNDCHFELTGVHDNDPNTVPMPERERAVRIMAKVKNIDLKDADKELDPEWGYLKKKNRVDFDTGEGLDEKGKIVRIH